MENNNTDNIDDIWAECSDEETFFQSDIKYRTTNTANNGSVRIWEPIGTDLIDLYQKIKTNGFVELDWKSTGRISPSQFELIMKNEQNSKDQQLNDQQQQQNNEQTTKTEFDFDNDFDDDLNDLSGDSLTKSRVMKKSPVIKKSQTATTTNLTKVMQDIKKYQQMDQV